MCALEGDLHFTSHNSKTMTISFSPEIIDQELELSELSTISGGVAPVVPIILLGGAAGLLYLAKKVSKAIDKDNVAQNLDSNCGGDSDCSGSNKLSYGGFIEKPEDPFGGAITGKQ